MRQSSHWKYTRCPVIPLPHGTTLSKCVFQRASQGTTAACQAVGLGNLVTVIVSYLCLILKGLGSQCREMDHILYRQEVMPDQWLCLYQDVSYELSHIL